jgi:hypothetical protein
MEQQLSGSHQKMYQQLFHHPLPHNLHWREVWSMLGAMKDAQAVEEENGSLKVIRNGQTLVLRRPKGKDLADAKELMHIRNFLERSEVQVAAPAKAGTHLLVVIDHRQARVFSTEMHGAVPQRVAPYDPFGFGRDLHYNQDDSNGQRKPELKSFYEAVAKTLHGAKQIVIFGTGTGASSAMEALVDELKKNHPDIAGHIIGVVSVDEHHLTDDQLLAKARELFVVGK